MVMSPCYPLVIVISILISPRDQSSPFDGGTPDLEQTLPHTMSVLDFGCPYMGRLQYPFKELGSCLSGSRFALFSGD